MRQDETRQDTLAGSDWSRRPLSFLLWWGLPYAVAVAFDLIGPPLRAGAAVWALALAWMGVGCVLNARRCHRVHCYISGPALLVAATSAGLLAAGVLDLGPKGLSIVTWAAFVAVLLSFAPEILWRRYAGS